MNQCKNCGGEMIGDGYTTPLHCETTDADGREADADPLYCSTQKFLLLGHAQHGKDTVAELMAEHWGITWKSSSVAALEIFMFPMLQELLGYETIEEAYEDRHDHRMLWKELITAYNYHDRARLCRDILDIGGNDMYIGMRCQLEYEASKDLFSKIFWVDASQRKPTDPSMTIFRDDCNMVIIPNNGSLEHLERLIKSPTMGYQLGRME